MSSEQENRAPQPEKNQAKPAENACCGKGSFTVPPREELILGSVASAVLIGWVIQWAQNGFTLFSSAFPALSFLASLGIAGLVAAKAFGAASLPDAAWRKLLPAACVLPLAGYLIEMLSRPHLLLTVGGSIALACAAAVMFWRRSVLEMAARGMAAVPETAEREEAKTEEEKETVAVG